MRTVRSSAEEREAKLREEFARGLGRVGRRLSDLEEARAALAEESKVAGPAPCAAGRDEARARRAGHP